MINSTDYRCAKELIEKSLLFLNELENPTTLNEPTGDFFTDPWQLKSEFLGTVWEEILSTLDTSFGQARIIRLEPASCYHSHADIDDRYHLNLQGEKCYLIDLDDQQMYEINDDGVWYSMNAGKIHSAVNFGRIARYQLLVRKLLPKNILQDSVRVKIFSPTLGEDDARFLFDNNISSWLNISYKKNLITDFKPKGSIVELSIEKTQLNSLKSITPQTIRVETYD